MKTFEKDLKPGITPEFAKWIIKLAHDTFGVDLTVWLSIEDIINHQYIFPLLLHRAVESLNYIIIDHERKEIVDTKHLKKLKFKDYQPSHLTACEMAIFNCLLGVFNETKER